MNILSSKCHGHIEAIICTFKGLGLPELVAIKPSLQRNIICALIASRIINPCPKLATQPHHIYEALDELGKRLLAKGGAVLYDLSSSYFEKKLCPLGAHGYSRDQKPKKLQVNYGLVCNAQGRPEA